MIEERDFTWTPEVEPDLVLDNVRDAIYGHIPAYVVTAEGKRAKAPDIVKIQDELARALSDSDGFNMKGYSASVASIGSRNVSGVNLPSPRVNFSLCRIGVPG